MEEITYLGKLAFRIKRFKDKRYDLSLIGLYYYPNGYVFNTKYTHLYTANNINI
jgi:hypothetical protein